VISLDWQGMNGQIGALMGRFDALPRQIAKKHLKAVMKRVLRPGVPVLKRLTPKGGTRTIKSTIQGGEFKSNLKRRGGALRRAVTTKSKYIGRNKDGVVYGVIGYKAGFESRKAIWLDQGTIYISPRQIMEKFRAAYKGPAAAALVKEMKKALEAAGRELASPKNSNPNYRRK
jgi:hypothetical protein